MHVAVGIVIDANARILIAERPTTKCKAGYWEFPGGKIEKGETVFQALQRELQEEIGIVIHSASPLICINYKGLCYGGFRGPNRFKILNFLTFLLIVLISTGCLHLALPVHIPEQYRRRES